MFLVVIILAIYILIVVKSISNTKGDNSSTKLSHTKSIIIFVIGLIILGIFFLNRGEKEQDNTTVADGFTIYSYNVNLDVKEDDKIDVTETIMVNWDEYGHHGIYKFTPKWLKYTGADGKTISRKAKIYDLQAVGEEYTIDTVNKKDRIKIGNPDEFIMPGLHEYIIKYTYDMGNDPYEDFDEFIFHAYGDYWGTPINDATITINMPKNFDSNKIKFFDDKYRKNDITKYVDYRVNGNTIIAKLSKDYELNSSLTVDIELPDNYFLTGENNYGNTSLILSLIIISFTVISFFNWQKFGKDYDKVSQTVEFYPPENMDASEIGYIYGKENTKKLTIALIIGLASKGYIKIEEQEDKNRIITKVKSFIKKDKITLEDVYEEIERCITVKLSNDYNSENALPEEKALIEDMFKESNEFIIRKNYDLFYKDYGELIKKNYIIVENDTINNFTQEALNNIQKTLEKKYCSDKESVPLTPNERCVYDNLFIENDKTNLKVNSTFYQTFATVGNNLDSNLDKKINDEGSYKKMISTSILFLIGTILWILSYSVFEDMNPKFKILYLISFISLFVIVLFMFLMTRKTTYGEMITARVLGFRNYIETAEKSRIEALVMENPNYFYDILPYAYVLGVSKKWIEKFENIPIPENDMGNFDYSDINSFNSLSDSVYAPPSSSSSSGCGGGCSSCGGGCSSCGGGGSW